MQTMVVHALSSGTKAETMGRQWWMRSQQRLMNVERRWANRDKQPTTLLWLPPGPESPVPRFSHIQINYITYAILSANATTGGSELAAHDACFLHTVRKKRREFFRSLFERLHLFVKGSGSLLQFSCLPPANVYRYCMSNLYACSSE